MAKRKSATPREQTVVIRMCKSHRVSVFIISALLIISILIPMIYLTALAESASGMMAFLCALSIIAFMPLPLYFASWKISFDKHGIHKQLFWLRQTSHAWTQVEAVHSRWSTAERSQIISIQFQNNKTIRFRMDCENAEKARKLILAHRSIT